MKVVKSLTAFAVLFICNLTFAENEKPDVLLYIRDPWLMVIGSDSPILAAYKTGQIIWQEKSLSNIEGYQSVTLNESEYADFVSKLKSSLELKENYALTNATDQPTEYFQFNLYGSSKSVNVYGSLTDEDNRVKAPKSLLEIYDFLAGYRNSKSNVWNPEFIEVMIWPYEYAPEKSIIWPKGWPDLNSKSTRKRNNAYSIYVPIKNKDALYKFINSIKEKGAVEINGRKWAVSTRTPFPHELAK